jgi:hypothetical protein
MTSLKRLLLLPSYAAAKLVNLSLRGKGAKGLREDQSVVAVKAFPATCFIDYNMTSAKAEITVPEGTELIYRGRSMHADLCLTVSKTVHKSIGPIMFARTLWIAELPAPAYSIEVACKDWTDILAAK